MRKVLPLLLAVGLLLGIPVVASDRVHAYQSVRLIVNYQRDAGDYDRWSLWLWPAGMEGAAHQFTGTTDYGAAAQVDLTVPDGIEEIGIIARALLDLPIEKASNSLLARTFSRILGDRR